MLVNFIVHFSANDYSREMVQNYCKNINQCYDGYEMTVGNGGNDMWSQRLYYYNVNKKDLNQSFLKRLHNRDIKYKILNKDIFNYNFD